MERWDAPYRRDRMPGWDVGRPSSHLVEAVEDGTFKPGRAIVFGCGSGTNAIYLASKGFQVTGVDVAPSALAVAAKKAGEAGVEVEWMLADVVSLPKLPPYDLVFDRGCNEERLADVRELKRRELTTVLLPWVLDIQNRQFHFHKGLPFMRFPGRRFMRRLLQNI